ncbi:hypothetical protein DKM44_12925 [Deinococcus irradiatisoli]|uniref:Holliday junction resolvase n=1 Tax=Deinococcus irradiatisoli TaxID=2202254 RepID=A0A2Z3JTV5_9DEIO|nr:hypothetical protein DKM44_12925 [Deinococcus irradiatisoli]
MGGSTPKRRVNSRAKGARGELELAHALTAAGFPASRGQQHKGGENSPDVVCEALRAFHIEAKLTATCKIHSPAQLALWDAQAQRDAGQFRTPLVIHRWNGNKIWWVRVLKPGWPAVWLTLPEFLTSTHIWEPV